MPELLTPPTQPAHDTTIAPAAPAPDKSTATDVSEEARGFLSNIFMMGDEEANRIRDKERADKEVAKPEPEKKAAVAPTEKPAAEDATKPEPDKPKSKPRKPQPAAVDPVELAVTTARETARAMGAELGDRLAKNSERREKDRTERAEASDTGALTAIEREKHEALAEMSKRYPDQYANTAAEFLDSLKAKRAYKAGWIRENPGKRYNELDEEHNSFFDSVEPVYDEHLYAKTIAALERRPLEEKLKESDKLRERVERMEAESESNRVAPIKNQHGLQAAVDVVRAINPDMLGQFSTPETTEAARKANPDVVEIVETHARIAARNMGTAVQLFELGLKSFSDSKPQDTEALSAFHSARKTVEARIKASPDQLDAEGRQFATWEEYSKLSASNPEAAARRWFLDQRWLAITLPAIEADRAKEKIAAIDGDFDRKAAARGYVKAPAVAAVPHQNGEAKPDPKPTTKPPDSPAAPAGKVQVSTTKPEDGNAVPKWIGNLVGRFNGV